MANIFNLTSLPDFNPDVEVGSSIAQKWETWLSDFTMFVVANGITNKTRKRALLLYIAASRVREIFATLADTGDDEDFESAKRKLTEYFSPQKKIFFSTEKSKILNIPIPRNEARRWSLDIYHICLRSAAKICEFHDVDMEVEQ